jgi:hypothetical protein
MKMQRSPRMAIFFDTAESVLNTVPSTNWLPTGEICDGGDGGACPRL